MTISGIGLPPGRVLELEGGYVFPNTVVEPWLEVGEEVFSNVTRLRPDNDAPDRPPRPVARWLLCAGFRSLEPIDLKFVHTYLERVALPLRLGTPGTVLLDALRVQKAEVTDFIPHSSNSAAPEPYGLNTFVDLSERECRGMETIALPQLSYRPAYELALMHFSVARKTIAPAEMCLELLVALETMFDPDNDARGRGDRVARRASAFAGTNVEQVRTFRKLLRQGYEHRNTLRHGERDALKTEAAKQWFQVHVMDLTVIAAWSFQRVLALAAADSSFDLDSHISQVDAGNDRALTALRATRLFWATKVRGGSNLDLRHFESSGASSVEFIPLVDDG